MYTQISVPLTSSPEHPLSLEPAKLFYPQIYGGMALLSNDKVVSCFDKGNATASSILDLPGATIVSPILLSMTGIVGQVTALYYLYRTTKPGLNRTVFYVLLATLIWTDLFGKLLTTPPAIISYAYGKWVGGVRLCHVHGFLMMTIGLVTHFLVAAMALDRFLCVRHGYFYKSSVTKSRIRLALMGIWLFCILFSMMPLFGIGEYEPQYPGTWCYVNIHVGADTWWCHRLYSNLYGLINIINVIIILTCNVIVIGTLIAARILRSRKFSASRQTQKIIPISTQPELELQTSILLLVITIVFIVSWFPIDTLIFLNQIWPHKCIEEHFKDVIAVRFASLSQIIDPWAYVICRKVFTSKVWKGCRSVIIGRTFSSKRHNSTLNNNRILCLENGGSCKSRTNESLSSTKRKFSLPTPDKSKVILNNLGMIRFDETAQPPPDTFGDYQKNPIYRRARKNGFNLDKGTSPYIPLCKTLSIKLPSNDIINPLDGGYQLVSYSPVCRKQFRISSDVTEGIFNANSQTQSENVRQKMTPVLSGRRHSWSYAAPSFYKHYRTKSTQTLENI